MSGEFGLLRSISYVLYFREFLEIFPWQLWWYGHLATSGCPARRALPVVAGFAIFYLRVSPHDVPAWCDVSSVGAWLCGVDVASFCLWGLRCL